MTCLLLNGFLHVFLLLFETLFRHFPARHPDLDIVIEAAGGEERKTGVRLENIDNTSFISMNKSDHSLGLLVPDEDVAAVAAADDELAPRPVEVDALDRGGVTVALVLVRVLRSLRVVGIEQVNVFVIVASEQFSSILAEHCACDVRLKLVGRPQVGGTMFDDMSLVVNIVEKSSIKHPYILITTAGTEQVPIGGVAVDTVNWYLHK